MIFYSVYILAIVVLVLHFTGFFMKRNLEWIPILSPVAVFSVIILDYLKII